MSSQVVSSSGSYPEVPGQRAEGSTQADNTGDQPGIAGELARKEVGGAGSSP